MVKSRKNKPHTCGKKCKHRKMQIQRPNVLPALIKSSHFRTIAPSNSPNQKESYNAEAIVLTCMDFRQMDDLVFMLNKLGLNNNYDHYILAGASFGLLTKDDNWTDNQKACDQQINASLMPTLSNIFKNDVNENDLQHSFYIHVILSVLLHNIKKIIIIDHMDCGACFQILTSLLKIPRVDEMKEYIYHVNSLQYFLKEKDENLKTIANMVHNKNQDLRRKILSLQMQCYIIDLDDNFVEVSL